MFNWMMRIHNFLWEHLFKAVRFLLSRYRCNFQRKGDSRKSCGYSPAPSIIRVAAVHASDGTA